MKFIAHDAPALRGESNYISRIDLNPFGFADLFEQVWLQKRDNGLFELCCIPFRAYGLALRDAVRVTSDGVLVYEIVRPSGHRVLRALFTPGRGRADIGQAGQRIEAAASEAGLLYEWEGNRYIAVDAPPNRNPDHLHSMMVDEEERGGLIWEWADVEHFRR